MINLNEIQIQHKEWQRRNFPIFDDSYLFEGIVEEVGELARARLKGKEDIGFSDWAEKEKDALGDILIFIIGYCNWFGYDIESIIKSTWDEVKKRDWQKHPGNGVDK